MKNFLKTFLLILFTNLYAQLNAATPPIVVVEGVETDKHSDNWIKVSVKFKIVSHPLESEYKRLPSNKEEVINLYYIDNLKVKLSICFSNEMQKTILRSKKMPDAEFYQYYNSEIEFLTLKFKKNDIYYANFLFPVEIAERDGFLSAYIKHVGHVVEFTIDGIPVDVESPILFENYKESRILEKFKQQAQANSPKNEGILIPGYMISSSFLDGAGPVKRKQSAGY